MPTVDAPAPLPLNPWQDRSDNSILRQPGLPRALPGRGVERAPACGPRNPLRRALTSFGRLLSRTFAAVSPIYARRASAGAARDTRAQLVHVLEQLASGEAGGASLAADLRDLATARHHWAQLDPRADARFQQSLDEVLDLHWPGAKGLELLTALARPATVAAQAEIGRGDGYTTGVFGGLIAAVRNVVTDRALDTVHHGFDDALAAVRSNALSSAITELAGRAVATGAALLAQLDGCGALEPVAPAGATQAAGGQPEAARTAQMLQSFLQVALAKDGAGPGGRMRDLDLLLQQLPPQLLQALRSPATRAPVDAEAASLDIGAAVEREIAGRPARLLGELEHLIEESPGFNPADEGEWSCNLAGRMLGSELQRVSQLRSQILEHCQAFNLERPEHHLATLLSSLDQRISWMPVASAMLGIEQLPQILAAAPSLLSEEGTTRLFNACLARVDSLELAALERVQSLLEKLARHAPAAQLLVEYKAAVTAIRDYLRASGDGGTAAGAGSFGSALSRLVAMQLSADPLGGDRGGMLAVLRAPEMQAVRGMLAQAQRQAAQFGDLNALRADLEDMSLALQTITEAVSPGDGSEPLPAPHAPDKAGSQPAPATLDALSSLFCIRLQPGGRVTLTTGPCAPPFAQYVTQRIEQPFSSAETATTLLPDGIAVPSQFLAEAMRGQEYFADDGQPLIDATDWDTLDNAAKQQRVAAGYRRLITFYDGNEAQTAAIVALAQQGTVAAFNDAIWFRSDHSPVVLEGQGAGILSAQALTTVRFSRGPDHAPRFTLTYEMQGGLFHPVGPELTFGGTDLDPARSRQKFSVVAEAHAGEHHLTVVGTPIYDVHLVASPVERS